MLRLLVVRGHPRYSTKWGEWRSSNTLRIINFRGVSTPKQELDVFISSDIGEFRNVRKNLSKTVNRIPFLKSIPLEQQGAAPEGVTEASLLGVRNCDIYVGAFGKEYSDTTVLEYKEAVKHRKLTLIYVKRAKRDPRIDELIEKDISSRFKYHRFRTNKELYPRVKSDLESLVSRILHTGVEEMRQRKDQAQKIEEKAAVVLTSPRREEGLTQKIFREAQSDFFAGKFLQTVILSTMALEAGLRQTLHHLTRSANRPLEEIKDDRFGIGQLISRIREYGILSVSEINRLQLITVMRNRALHEGWTPSKEEAGMALRETKSILEKLSERMA